MKPSELDRTCAGVELVRKHDKEIKQAELDGSRMHKLLEMSIAQRTSPESVDTPFKLYQEQIAMVHDAHRYILSMAGGYDRIQCEVEIDLSKIAEEERIGYADVVITRPSCAFVIDAKFGPSHRRLVAREHKQLISYAAGIASNDKSVSMINLVILQPAIGHMDSFVIDRQTAIEKAKSFFKRSECQPGNSCERCDMRGSCSARVKHNLTKLPEVLDHHESLSNSQLADLLPQAQSIINWLEDLKTEARKRVEGGQRIHGYRLVSGKQKREWVDADKAQIELTRHAIEKAITEKVVVPISPAQAEKILGEEAIRELIKFSPMPSLLMPEIRKITQ